MFQVESRAQMSCLHGCIRCVSTTLCAGSDHPAGPIVGKMVNPYLKRRQGASR